MGFVIGILTRGCSESGEKQGINVAGGGDAPQKWKWTRGERRATAHSPLEFHRIYLNQFLIQEEFIFRGGGSMMGVRVVILK